MQWNFPTPENLNYSNFSWIRSCEAGILRSITDDGDGGGGGGDDDDDDDDDDDGSLPEGRFIGFTPPGDETSEVASRCLPHRQLWVSHFSKVATQWFEVDSNLRPSSYKTHDSPLHHRVR